MPWLLLLFAVGLFLVALGATSMTVVILCVLLSLTLSVVAIMSLLAQRVDNSARSETMLIDPMELRRLREQAEAKRAQSSSGDDAAMIASATAAATPDTTHSSIWGGGGDIGSGGDAGGGGTGGGD